MNVWSAWQPNAHPGALLALGASRFLLALGLAGVLWLPLPADALGAHARPWAIVAMSSLTLAALLAYQRPPGVNATAWGTWSTARRSLLMASLIAILIALTGGLDSPLAGMVVLLSFAPLPADAHPDVWNVWRTGLIASVCYFVGAMITLPVTPPALDYAWMAERSLGLALLAAGVCYWHERYAAASDQDAEMRRALARWQAEALALERARGQMLAHVSHELLGPLTAIRSSAGVLSELGALGEQLPCERTNGVSGRAAFERMVTAISRNAARLELCVQDLLELARLEESQPTLAARWHDCGEMLDRAVELLEPFFVSKSQHVRVRVSAPHLAIWGDGRRIERVATNLLANAHKYAGVGATINLLVAPDAEGTRLEVSDDGPGVAADTLERLFDRYYRAPGAPGRGSGLGLAIVQAEVELHGGKVWAESAADRGARFVCLFPHPPLTAENLTERLAEVNE